MDEGLKQSAEELTENGRMCKGWVMIALVLITWIVAAATQYGINSAHSQDTDRRLAAAESALDRKIDRTEYDARQKDVIDRLQRIENKIDRAAR